MSAISKISTTTVRDFLLHAVRKDATQKEMAEADAIIAAAWDRAIEGPWEPGDARSGQWRSHYADWDILTDASAKIGDVCTVERRDGSPTTVVLLAPRVGSCNSHKSQWQQWRQTTEEELEKFRAGVRGVQEVGFLRSVKTDRRDSLQRLAREFVRALRSGDRHSQDVIAKFVGLDLEAAAQ